MKRPLFLIRTISLASVMAVATVGLSIAVSPAEAATTTVSSSSCTTPTVFQPFLGWEDSGYYTMVPGESLDNFAGTGWTLSGGATVTQQTLADGHTGLVLDMPSGSKAVSPDMCIGDGMPLAKTLIRYASGNSGAVSFQPYDLTTNTPHESMNLTAFGPLWTATPPVNVLPGAVNGWHIMQFTYVAGGQKSDFQLYDFGVDPHMRG